MTPTITPQLIDFYDTIKEIFEASHQINPVSIYNPQNNLLINLELIEKYNIQDYFIFIDLDEFPLFISELNKNYKTVSNEFIYNKLIENLMEFIKNELMERNQYYKFIKKEIGFIKTPANFCHNGEMLEFFSFYEI